MPVLPTLPALPTLPILPTLPTLPAWFPVPPLTFQRSEPSAMEKAIT